MSERKVLCEECRDRVEFNVVEKEIVDTLKGENYTYMGKEAYCSKCGAEVYVDDVIDFNLEKLYDAYREKNDIISLETILKIPEKYSIGKRPLSILLGWGELTFSRYCDGGIPTKQYSDMLKKIYNEPSYYAKILEENKDKISRKAYEKSREAVDGIVETSVNGTKMDLAIEYLLSRCDEITPLTLQKALYYIQGFYFAFYEKFIFTEECEAWVHGPVYTGIYARYSHYGFNPIEGMNGCDDSALSSSEKLILDSVIKNICCYSGGILKEFTHSEYPWIKTRGELSEKAPSNEIIPTERIGAYFKTVKENYNMTNPNDIKAYTQIMLERMC